MQIGESIAPPALGQHDATCPFCGGEQPQLRNYKTKNGARKNERTLAKNLAATGTVTQDSLKGNVGPTYPQPGGEDDHRGWEIKEDVLMEFAVGMTATPHHLIPGNASMAKSSKLEQWTREDLGVIMQDIGYTIDGARNGIWLPNLPEIYSQKRVRPKGPTMMEEYGTQWSQMRSDEKHTVAYMIQSELWLQFHYTDHDDPYHHIDTTESYDGNALARCDLLGELLTKFWSVKCPQAKPNDKFYPPYGLVERINLQSDYMRIRITGNPRRWREWVTELAQDFTHDLLEENVSLTKHFLIDQRS